MGLENDNIVTINYKDLIHPSYSHDLATWDRIQKGNEEMAEGSEAYSSKTGTRLLFNVFVVDPVGDGEVVFSNLRVIALNKESAIRKTVSLPEYDLKKDLDNYDIIVQNLCDWGSIRPKV